MPEEPLQPPPASVPSADPGPPPDSGQGHPGLRVAISSSGSNPAPWWVWVATLGSIVVGGLTLHAARWSIAPTLDRWLPALESAPEEAAPEVTEIVEEPQLEPEEPAGPEWTPGEIEAAIVPLPETTRVLISEGRDELSQFTGLDSSDETRALPARNRWRLWGRIWRNRVDQIRGQLPPQEGCEPHPELQPTCRALGESLAILERVPASSGLDQARAAFSEAAWVLAAYQGPPPRPSLGRR